jgi:hypothetical protein
VSGSVGVWGRLAALLVLCAMLSVVLAVAGPSADAQADWNQVGADIDGEAAFDYSGSSVAMNDVGDTIIIGAHLNDGNGDASGQARVFTLTDGAWNQVGDDIDGEAAGDWSSYSVAMNDVGDTVIIGAPLNDGNGDASGQARVFTLIDGAWNQVGGDIDGEAANDYFGWSVAMNNVGDTVIIGAPLNDGNGEDSGHVRVFTLIDGAWVQVGGDIDGEAANDESGVSVAMNDVGDTVIIGAPLNDGNGDASGQARVYQLTDGAWNQVGDDIDGEAAGDWSSYSVAMNDVGDTVIIGALLNDGNGDASGQARVFTLIDGAWNQVGDDIDGEAANDYFGSSVAMNAVDDTVIIGAPLNDGNGDASGQARVFTLTDGAWNQVGDDIDGEAANDYFGWSVAMNNVGDTVIIGAAYDDGNGEDSGHVRVFRSAPTPTPTPTAAPQPTARPGPTPTPEPAAATSVAGDGVAGPADTGTSTTTLAYLAVGLIAFGALLVPAIRRRN